MKGLKIPKGSTKSEEGQTTQWQKRPNNVLQNTTWKTKD